MQQHVTHTRTYIVFGVCIIFDLVLALVNASDEVMEVVFVELLTALVRSR